MIPLLTVTIVREEDVVLARQRARHVAQLLDIDQQDQIRFATAVSELARNTYEYAGGGQADFVIDDTVIPLRLVARFRDTGPGISHLDAVLDGSYVSPTGMGLGILGARRLSDTFRIDSTPGQGTTIEIAKILVRQKHLTTADVRRLVDALVNTRPEPTVQEIQQQNHELLAALEETRQQRDEVERLNAELAETNRGVLALYAELDDRAAELKQAAEAKSRFFSEMSHELRTPLASISSVSWLLINRVDGPLTNEQAHQVTLISKAAETLRELVDDTLDLAKIEAGGFTPRRGEFRVEELFAALRGMFRPILGNTPVALTFEIAPGLPTMVSDETRVAQVLRNFIANAIKFTPRGEIHSARCQSTPVPYGLRYVILALVSRRRTRNVFSLHSSK
jgi:signal transduction histidine kinase